VSFFLGGIAVDNQNKNHEKILRGCQWVFFIIYVIFLLRITFFKQATLNNLFSAVGASERTISIIPFKSIYDMAVSNISIGRYATPFCAREYRC
jgi:glycopeptide antibiotics resistance protein